MSAKHTHVLAVTRCHHLRVAIGEDAKLEDDQAHFAASHPQVPLRVNAALQAAVDRGMTVVAASGDIGAGAYQ